MGNFGTNYIYIYSFVEIFKKKVYVRIFENLLKAIICELISSNKVSRILIGLTKSVRGNL